jgi:hypothetical protein
VKSSYRNVAFARVPKTPPRRLPQAFESIRWEMGGSGVPKSDVCRTKEVIAAFVRRSFGETAGESLPAVLRRILLHVFENAFCQADRPPDYRSALA